MNEGDRRADRAGGRVVFPSPAAVLDARAAAHNVTSCALLRLNDGTAAFAGTVRAPWIDARFDALRQALIRHLAAAAAGEASRDDPELRCAASAVSDRRLSALHPARLAEIARSYAHEYAPRRAALDAELQRTSGSVFWPLLPCEGVAAGGTRHVKSLATRAALLREGIARHLWIAKGTELEHTVRSCAAGKAYLLSIRGAHRGRPSVECTAALRDTFASVAGRGQREFPSRLRGVSSRSSRRTGAPSAITSCAA